MYLLALLFESILAFFIIKLFDRHIKMLGGPMIAITKFKILKKIIISDSPSKKIFTIALPKRIYGYQNTTEFSSRDENYKNMVSLWALIIQLFCFIFSIALLVMCITSLFIKNVLDDAVRYSNITYMVVLLLILFFSCILGGSKKTKKYFDNQTSEFISKSHKNSFVFDEFFNDLKPADSIVFELFGDKYELTEEDSIGFRNLVFKSNGMLFYNGPIDEIGESFKINSIPLKELWVYVKIMNNG